ncbi:MAG: bifunctional folylpolyglutamate synthase/dihydrofolate synthase [Solirubrobacteraceae bacterium]
MNEHQEGKPTLAGDSSAERQLRKLELFGMRFGLDRVRRMMTVLGSPERRFSSIHVLGTNGKSSTTRMIAAILQRHGLRTGAYLSPHLCSYTERIQVAEREIASRDFDAAIDRATWASERVNRTLAEDDHVTQFELLTAAAYWELARQEVEVAVVEAGLGGRYDATSVIDASVTVLTNVALEHTRWLGPTITDIAREKLAVLSKGQTLAIGGGLHPQASAVVQELTAEREVRVLEAPTAANPDQQPLVLASRGAFQRRNFALARLAAEAYLEGHGIALEEQAIRQAAQQTKVDGRLQIADRDPLLILDGAHNPDAAAALVNALAEIPGGWPPGGRPLGLLLGVLEDKDAAGMLARLLPFSKRAWFTAPASSRALSPAALVSLSGQLGFENVQSEPRPADALAAARDWARAQGSEAVILATGSIYLVGELLGLIRDERPRTDQGG